VAICLTKCFRFAVLAFPLDIIDITHGTSVLSSMIYRQYHVSCILEIPSFII